MQKTLQTKNSIRLEPVQQCLWYTSGVGAISMVLDDDIIQLALSLSLFKQVNRELSSIKGLLLPTSIKSMLLGT